MKNVKWYNRIQFDIGGRWQLLPDKTTTWRQWIISPSGAVIWPGKVIRGRQDVPECFDLIDAIDIVVDPDRDPDTGLRRSTYLATFYQISGCIRVLGLDIGIALYYQPIVDKETK